MSVFNQKSSHPSEGFTLIELLVVIAIIMILIGIALPNCLNAQVRAKFTRARTEMRSVAIALESYRTEETDYPYYYLYRWEYPDKAQPPIAEYGTLEQNIGELSLITTPAAYIKSIPNDPFGQKGIQRDVPYDYISFKAFAKANFVMGDSPWKTKWMLRSRGPNRNMVSMVPYTPTNGTYSLGTISFSGDWDN